MRSIRSATLLFGGAFLVGIASVHAQKEPTIDPSQVTVINPVPAVRDLQAAARQSASFAPDIQPAGPILKVWPYTFVSPRDGMTYSGNIVGTSPFNRGARVTNVPVVIIPLRVEFTGLLPRTFDPTSPDDGCLGAGHTALSLTQGSPIFNPVTNYTINGVNLGNVTLPDAFQRASFYPQVSTNSPAWHLALNTTLAAKQTIQVANDGVQGRTATPSMPCSTNPIAADNPNRVGIVDINFIDPLLNAIIVNLGINRSQFPLFLVYDIVMSIGNASTGPCCVLGYHNGAQILNTTDPEQTYGIAEYDQGILFGPGVKDISVLSHEVMEWVNDPSTNNAAPRWGNIGQVGPCPTPTSGGQTNLETGDPLSGTLEQAILMPNGVTYHPQEQAFFGWFLAAPPATGGYAAGAGAGNKYSSNGTFGGFAKACPPGGSN